MAKLPFQDAIMDEFIGSISHEIRTTSPTGGEKGTKPEQYDDIPTEAIRALARVYAMGADKYERGNYRKGYDWSLSYSALMRHLWSFWQGEDIDPESGESHLMHAAWHCFTLFHFTQTQRAYDDRQTD